MAVWSQERLFSLRSKEIFMTISVIIPYYNPDCNSETDRLLIRAARSVIDNLAGVCDYEIVIVNDGSPSDPCVDLLPEIKYIRREHGMLGAARNTGIDNATGNIIAFLDADDCYYPDSLAPCLKVMQETGTDLLGFGMKRIIVTDGEPVLKPSSERPAFSKPVTGNRYMCTHNLPGSACRYLISSALIRNNNLRFMENAFIEDEEFTPRMMHFSKKYTETVKPVYAYCIRSGSIITDVSQQMVETKSADTVKALSSLVRFREEHVSEPHDGLDRKISYLAMDHIRRTLRRRDWRNAINEQTGILGSMGLFPLKCKDGSVGFKLYSLFSRYRAGLSLLHLAETFYK